MHIHRNSRSIAGRWKFATDPDGKGDFQEPDASIESWQRQVTYFDLEYDDTAWDKIAVPACWQTEGHRYNGIAWYRTRFDYAPDGANNVIRLLFKGVDYFADAWLNGYYLGSHEGFFRRFSFDASRWIRPGENLLVVKVDAPNLKRVLMKGALQGINWDCNDPTLDPGGIWNDVQLLASRDLYVEDLKITPFIDLERSSARVLCRATLCNTTPGIKKVSVTGTLSPHNFAGEPHAASTPVVLPPGVSQADLWLDLDAPRLWWPWDMGAQNLYDVAVSVTDEAGELDRVGDRIGLRHLRKEQANGWEIYLNGKRIFCRGPNYVSEQLQSTMTRARYEFDVQLMKDANMNMVRSYCVVEREEFYDVCDEKGDILRRWIGEPDSLEQLIRDSQEYQAFHLKYHTEFYRRHKFRPCNGALFFQFKDCWPAVTAALVDYYGRPKRAYYTLKQACNPIHVLMDWPPLAGEPAGSTFRRDLFVVNDFHHPYPTLHVKWQIRDASGAPLFEHEFACSIPANSLTKVADVVWTIPPTPGACYCITLELTAPAGPLSTNDYRLAVQGPSPSPPGAAGCHPPIYSRWGTRRRYIDGTIRAHSPRQPQRRKSQRRLSPLDESTYPKRNPPSTNALRRSLRAGSSHSDLAARTFRREPAERMDPCRITRVRVTS